MAFSGHIRGMKTGWRRERATTRVAPTTGLPAPIFIAMTICGCESYCVRRSQHGLVSDTLQIEGKQPRDNLPVTQVCGPSVCRVHGLIKPLVLNVQPCGAGVVEVRQRPALEFARSHGIRCRVKPALPESVKTLRHTRYNCLLIGCRVRKREGLKRRCGGVSESRFDFTELSPLRPRPEFMYPRVKHPKEIVIIAGKSYGV